MNMQADGISQQSQSNENRQVKIHIENWIG